MSTDLTLYRGESRVITLTVTDPATKQKADLSTGTWQIVTCEFQVKVTTTTADPALISKSIGSGITVLAQSGATLGQLQISLSPTDTEDTDTPPGLYKYDVVATFTSGARVYLVKPSKCLIAGVVNQL